MTCAKHQTTVKNELSNRVSHFQKQVDEKESSKLVVLQEAFPCSVLACKGVHCQQEDHFPPQVDGALGS